MIKFWIRNFQIPYETIRHLMQKRNRRLVYSMRSFGQNSGSNLRPILHLAIRTSSKSLLIRHRLDDERTLIKILVGSELFEFRLFQKPIYV